MILLQWVQQCGEGDWAGLCLSRQFGVEVAHDGLLMVLLLAPVSSSSPSELAGSATRGGVGTGNCMSDLMAMAVRW